MSRLRKPVFLSARSYRLYMKAVERRQTPPSGHYPVGYAHSPDEARRALRRRFPDNDTFQNPGDPRENEDAFVFDASPDTGNRP